MKRIIIIFLMLVVLSACKIQKDEPTSYKSSSASPEVSSSVAPSATDNSTIDKRYSFSEVDALYGPGPFSVNDLTKIFGEPSFIGGYRWSGGAFAINVSFNDIQFDLVANNGEKLNFIVKDASATDDFDRYTVTESDKAVRMKPLNSWVAGEEWPLLRNMKIGDTRDKLTKAYNGDKGQEDTAEGQLAVSYNYGQSGYISYIFHDETGDKLESVSINWYDGNLLMAVTPTVSGASLPPLPPMD